MKNIKHKLSKINQKIRDLYQMEGINLLLTFNSHYQNETQLGFKTFLQLLKETNNSIALEPRRKGSEHPFGIQLKYDGIMYFALLESVELQMLRRHGIIRGKIKEYIKKEER
jgi:hypothetical protein